MAKKMKNILSDRKVHSDLLWAFRTLNPIQPYSSQYASKTIKSLSKEVLDHISPQNMIGGEEDDQVLAAKIKMMMDEISCSYNQTLIRCLGIVFSKLLKHYYTGVFVNEDQISKIKTMLGNSPVIFLPSHRSYCDFIIMAFVCFALEIEIPCVAAAIDFSSMKIIGNMLRDCKAFFIRRNFNSGNLYKFIFQRYLQYLVLHGNSPVEFFIEGTRSRTGKALTPKFGLLKTIVDTFTENDVSDIMILPIGISYDRVIEDMLFSCEVLGIPKPPESTKGFFKALSTMDEKYGNIYINFGEPIYLRSYLMKHDVQSWPSNSGDILEKLGFHIVHEQQKLQKILCIHLLSIALHEQYMKNNCTTLSIVSAYNCICQLKSFIQAFEADLCLSNDIFESLYETLAIHKSLFSVINHETIQLNKFRAFNLDFYERKLKDVKLKKETITDSIPLLKLQQYINPLLCILASPSLLVMLLQFCYSVEHLLEKYIFCRDIFMNEFIFIEDDNEKDFQRTINYLLKFNIIKIYENNIAVVKESQLSYTLSSILYPFIVTYECTCNVLLNAPEEQALDNITKLSQLLVEERILKHYQYHHASLSLDSMHQAVNALVRLSVISKINRNSCDKYVVSNYDLLRKILGVLGHLLKSHLTFWEKFSACKVSYRSKL